MPERRHFEVIIIGAGIAGASLAYFLTDRGVGDVLILEREPQPGYHATGRSAATLVEWDLVPPMQLLKALGASFLRRPPAGFSDHALVDTVGVIVTFQDALWQTVQARIPAMRENGTSIEYLSAAAVIERVPVLAPAYVDTAVLLPEDGHIDVHELHWSYLRHAAQRGAARRCGVEVRGLRVHDGRCHAVETTAGTFTARWIVNAGGAWAEPLAAMANAAPIRFTPYRRHIVTFAAPEGLDVRRWPLVTNESQQLYFKPESGGLLASPMDETPLRPCDVQPDELLVAETLDKLGRLAPPLLPKTLRRRWAGLRTFAPDRVCVVGEDSRIQGFFWLAGQGGCGIETSPAVGQLAADLLIDGRTSRVDAAIYSPARFT